MKPVVKGWPYVLLIIGWDFFFAKIYLYRETGGKVKSLGFKPPPTPSEFLCMGIFMLQLLSRYDRSNQHRLGLQKMCQMLTGKRVQLERDASVCR